MNLSIIIPVYNETARLPQALEICRQALKKNPNWEFIFVDDGSTDNTADLISRAGFKLIAYSQNQGKGYALKQGVAAAAKTLTLIADVDWSTPLSQVNKLYAALKNNDLVIGSRKVANAKIIAHQPWLREWLGRQFTNLTNLWLGTNVSDVTCGFKLFKTPVAKRLFSLSKIKRWGYDAEILYLTKKLKLKVAEVPVVWKNDQRTKVSLFKDIVRSLTDLILIRIYHG
jgi:glycosyltransferase involved in cell wall biosynthesis